MLKKCNEELSTRKKVKREYEDSRTKKNLLMKEYEEKCSKSENQSEEDDDDVMFGKIDDSATPTDDSATPTKGSSFWGKSIYKKNTLRKLN